MKREEADDDDAGGKDEEETLRLIGRFQCFGNVITVFSPVFLPSVLLSPFSLSGRAGADVWLR